MPSTSPYTQNDYQTLQFRPWTLPVNDMFKAVQVKNQYWNQGAERIKSVYDNALGLELTKEDNIQIRDKFIQDSRDSLKKLSSKNLSDPEVQKQGLSLFEPIFKDDGIKYDNAYTKHIKSVRGSIEAAKTADGGKYYNHDNEAYALEDYETFLKSTDRNIGKELYGKRREYEQYYDYKKDFADIASRCTPDKVTSSTLSGLYNHMQTDNSQTKSNLTGCLTTELNPKAWRQINIEAAVRYKGRTADVANAYSNLIVQDAKMYAQEILDNQILKKKLKDSGQLTKELEEQFTTIGSQLTRKVLENNDMLSKIASGDYREIESNFENYAGMVYGRQNISDYAEAKAFVDKKEENKDSPAAMMVFKMNNDNQISNRNFNFEVEKFKIEQDFRERELQQKLITALNNGDINKAGGNLLQLLGIDGIANNLTTGIDAGNNETEGQTLEGLQQSLEADHTNRMNIGMGLFNTLTEIYGKEHKDALVSITGNPFNGGQLSTEKAFEQAERLLANYDKPTDSTLPKLNSVQVEDLRRQANMYRVQRGKVHGLMNTIDKVKAEIAKDPKTQEYISNYNKAIDGSLDIITNKGGRDLVFYDDSLKKSIQLSKKDLQSIANNSHPTYKIENGELLNKVTNVPLNVEASEIGGITWTGLTRKWKGNSTIQGDPLNATLMQGELGTFINLVNKKREGYNSNVINTLKEVTKNKQTYGISNIPGVNNYLKSKVSIIPELSQSGIIARPKGNAFKKADGEWYQETEFFTIDKETKLEVKLENKDVSEKVSNFFENNNSVTEGGAFSNIHREDDNKVLLKVSDIISPVVGPASDMQEQVNNEIYNLKDKKLSNREKVPVVIKDLPRGYKIGFNIVGTGTGKGVNSYQIFVIDPSGTKTPGGETLDQNQVSNKLQELEKQIKTTFRL